MSAVRRIGRLVFLSIIFCAAQTPLTAQVVRVYETILKADGSRVKGYLKEVTPTCIILQTDTGVYRADVVNIRQILVRARKRPFQSKKILTYDPLAEDNYEYRANGQRLRKDGGQDPGIGEQIAGHATVGVLNTTANLLRLPFYAINPALEKVKVNGKPLSPATVLELSYYSQAYEHAVATHGLPKLP